LWGFLFFFLFPFWFSFIDDPELPLHGCYVSVTIQKCTEVPQSGKSERWHFHLGFQYKMYQRVPPTFCRVRHSGSGYEWWLRFATRDAAFNTLGVFFCVCGFGFGV
jgi:hypothetical protein